MRNSFAGIPIPFYSTTTRAAPNGPAQPGGQERARARLRGGSSHGYCPPAQKAAFSNHTPWSSGGCPFPEAFVSARPRNRLIEKADGFAREFGLQRIELPGGTTVAKGCYERAKSSLAARPESPPPEARTRSLNSKGCPAAMLAICRMTRKKFLGE